MHVHPEHDRVVEPIPSNCNRNFSLPYEVIDDPSLSHAEKRAILAEWASDRSAVESYPTLRRLSGTMFPVTLSSVMDARLKLDEMMPAAADEHEQCFERLVMADFVDRRASHRSVNSCS